MNDKFLEEKYGLKGTIMEAFRTASASEKDLNWWTDRKNELEKWRKILKESTEINKNFIVFIIGSYGRGKTLSLLKIVNESKIISKEIFPVYLNFKSEEKSKPGLDFMFRIFKSINFDKLVENKGGNEIENAINEIPEHFDEMQSVLRVIYSKKIKEEVMLYNAGLKKSEESKAALNFLKGEIKPTAAQLKKIGIQRKIDNVDIAKEYLAIILCFMRKLGYKSFVLAIDEFEYLFSLTSKSNYDVYLALLRGLYDFPIGLNISQDEVASIVFFIAVSEDGWDKLQDMVKKEVSQGGPKRPLMGRIDLETPLQNFDREKTEELIKKVLSYNRGANKFEDNPLIPFSEDFVDYVSEITNGLPREIKNICAHVLDAGIADKVPLLTKEYAKKVVEERGL